MNMMSECLQKAAGEKGISKVAAAMDAIFYLN